MRGGGQQSATGGGVRGIEQDGEVFVWGQVFEFRNQMLDGSYKTFVILKFESKRPDPNVVWKFSDSFFAK